LFGGSAGTIGSAGASNAASAFGLEAGDVAADSSSADVTAALALLA